MKKEIDVNQELWNRVKTQAEWKGITISKLVERMIEFYLDNGPNTDKVYKSTGKNEYIETTNSDKE